MGNKIFLMLSKPPNPKHQYTKISMTEIPNNSKSFPYWNLVIEYYLEFELLGFDILSSRRHFFSNRKSVTKYFRR